MLKNILGIQTKINYKFVLPSFKAFGAYRGNPALNSNFEKERAEYKKQKKEMNKKHIQDFWTEQTKVENEYLQDFFHIQKEKKRRDDAKMRTCLIKNAFKCYTQIQTEIENQKVFLAKQRAWREEDTQELLEKHSLLNILDRQAEEDWLTPDNIESKLSFQINKILPPTILSHVDYYKKLNKYALYMEAGMLEEAEELKLNKQVIDYKNKLLQPLFEELKMVIRHLTYTEENAVFSLYKETILRIENYLNPEQNKDDANFLKDKMTHLFKRLISLIRLENEKADNKIEVIEKQLKALTMILVIWNRYVEIVYKAESEIEELIRKDIKGSDEFNSYKDPLKNKSLEDLLEEKNPRVLKEYYMSQITDKKAKGSGLFIRDIRGLNDDASIRREIDEILNPELAKIQDGHSQVKKVKELKQEEYTTESDEDAELQKLQDTNTQTEELQKNKSQVDEVSVGEKKSSEVGKKKTSKKGETIGRKKRTGINQEKRKLLDNEVAEVFDDEDTFEEESFNETELTADKGKSETDSSSISMQNSTKAYPSLTSDQFTDPLSPNLTQPIKKQKKERKLLEEHMLLAVKRQVEKSKFSNLDVETEMKNYKANLVKELGLKDEKDLFADIDKELEDVDLSKVINMNEYENELKKEHDRLSLEKEFENSKKEDLFQSSLFDNMIKYSKDIFDFKNPKISTDLDIYDENLIKFLEYSVKESNIIHKSSSSSIIMEFIKEELHKIDEEELSPGNKLKKKHLVKVAEVVGKMRITDSQNLKRVFDMNKHPSIKF